MSGVIRVGVFSDSHGDCAALRTAAHRAGVIDAAIFLGDYADDAHALIDMGIPVSVVRGNNDFRSQYPDELLLDIGGVRIFCTHGHRFGVYYDLYKLCAAAREKEADVALFGHTHRPCLDMHGKLLIVNPGSVSEPRFGSSETYAVLTISEGSARADIEYVYG